MSTYLELCQKAARESGVISGVLPTAVTDQTGDLLKLVNWVADAFEWVENEETGWFWLQKAWTGALTADNRTYTPSSFNLTDHAVWITDDLRRGIFPVSIYLTATGVSDEQRIRFITYEEWSARFDVGTQETNRPQCYTISPAGEIIFAQTPDASYTARGKYRRAPIRPTANGNSPAWPARFHDIAAWEGARRLAEHDEAWAQAQRCEAERDKLMSQLRRDQLPPLQIKSKPLA